MTLTTVKTTALNGTITNAQLAGSIDLTAKVTGTLPIANGGTNSTATTFVNAATNVTGTLPVGSGGTGLTSGTTNQILKFSGSTTLVSAAEAAGGKIGQVVYNENNNPTTISSTSTSYITTGITVTITPTAADSKILLMFSSGVGSTAASGESMRQWYRNIDSGGETALGAGGYGMANYALDSFTPYELTWIDSPSTTSSTVYSMWYKSDNASNIAYAVWNSSYYYMSAMEILA